MTPALVHDRPAARRWTGLLLVALAGIIWGTIGPGVQLVNDRSDLAPLTISAYRAVAAVAVLILLALVSGRLVASWSRARLQWRRVVVVGLLTATFQMLFFIAVVATGAGVATVICLGFAPVLLMVLDSVRERRTPPLGRFVTVAMALAGLGLVSFASGAGDQAPRPVLGVVTALGAGAAYALSTQVAGPLTQRLDTMTVTTSTMTVAGAVLVPVGLLVPHLRGDVLTTPDAGSWLLILYLGVITMAVAYALLFTGLRTTPGGSAVIATLIEPVTAVALAVLLLNERLSPVALTGCLLIVAAIASLGRAPRPRPVGSLH